MIDALVIIDVQKALITGAYHEAEVLDAIHMATDRIRRTGGLIVYVQHSHSSFDPMKKGSRGWELHASLDVRDEDLIIDKTASDSFYDTGLDRLLRDRGVEHLYIAGLQTEFCVDASCRAALSLGYRVTLISDGHTTGDAVLSAQQTIDHHNHVLSNLAHPTHQIALLASTQL